MKSKIQKKEELKNIKSKLPNAKITVFATFAPKKDKGLSVAQMQTLKRFLRELDSEYMVTKKTIINRAVKDIDAGIDVSSMEGSLGMVIGKGDPYAISKKLYEFSKANQALQFWGALFDGKFLGKDQFIEMAKLPSREVLIGRLLGMLTYPMRGLAVVLSEIAKKKEVVV